jgi:hypothetical protein
VAAGFMVEACLRVGEGDQVRVQEDWHLTLEGAAPFGSVKTIFRLSRQWSDPVAVTVRTSIGYGKRPEGRHHPGASAQRLPARSSAPRRNSTQSAATHRGP